MNTYIGLLILSSHNPTRYPHDKDRETEVREVRDILQAGKLVSRGSQEKDQGFWDYSPYYSTLSGSAEEVRAFRAVDLHFLIFEMGILTSRLPVALVTVSVPRREEGKGSVKTPGGSVGRWPRRKG